MSACYIPPPPSFSTKLDWRRYGFNNFNIYVHDTISDGHCLLHTIMCGIHVPYRLGYKDGVRMNRTVEMRRIRNKMANALEEIDPKSDIPNYYIIGGGALADFGVTDPEFSLRNVKKVLNSSAYLGNEHIIMISYFLKISIYVLDESRQDIYCFDVLPDETKSAIVTLYSERGAPHYELISIKVGDGTDFITHFAPDHEFINFLRRRMISVKNNLST